MTIGTDTYLYRSPQGIAAWMRKREGKISNRLQEDPHDLAEQIQQICADTKRKLEARVGHPIQSAMHILETEANHVQQDREIERRVCEAMMPQIHTCDYQWQHSRWARHTEEELGKICP